MQVGGTVYKHSNPVIQNTLGRAVKIHLENWLFLSSSSVNQNPSVDDSHEIFLRISGTLESYIESRASRKF